MYQNVPRDDVSQELPVGIEVVILRDYSIDLNNDNEFNWSGVHCQSNCEILKTLVVGELYSIKVIKFFFSTRRKQEKTNQIFF